MRKVVSVLLSLAVLMGYLASYAIPIFADNEETTSPPTEPCIHIFGEWENTGDTHSQTCSACGVVNSVNHAWMGELVTLQPTCGTAGMKTVTCRVCGATKEETVPPIGNHTLTDLTPINDYGHSGTCSVCGLAANQPHTWGEGNVTQAPNCKDSGMQTLTCTGCQHSKTESIPANGVHTFSSLTSVDGASHTGTCTVCSQEVPQAHTWDGGSIKKPATCLEEGEIIYTCTGCQYYRSETLELLTTHSWTKWQNMDETTHKRICTVCQIEEAGEHSYDSAWHHDEETHFHECLACGSQKNVKDHFPGPEATETDPQICLVCQYVIAPALNHDHDFAKDWTSDQNGHWHACAECEEKGEFADHEFENDCDPDCQICGYERETAHNYGEEWSSDQDGHYHECTICGDIQDQSAHTSGDQECTICGYEPTEEDIQETTPNTTGTGSKKKSLPVWCALVIAGVAAILIPIISFFQREFN